MAKNAAQFQQDIEDCLAFMRSMVIVLSADNELPDEHPKGHQASHVFYSSSPMAREGNHICRVAFTLRRSHLAPCRKHHTTWRTAVSRASFPRHGALG
jgi:hypothetical protein